MTTIPLETVGIGRVDDGETLSTFTTFAGATMGMTHAEVKRPHSDIVLDTKQGDGGPFRPAILRPGGRETLFDRRWPPGKDLMAPYGDAAVIVSTSAGD